MVENINMDKQKRKDLNLRLGNLFLAIFLATVPTAITYGTLSIHGLNICRNLNSKISSSYEIKKICDEFALKQLVHEPTRGNYLLDLCLTDLEKSPLIFTN